MHIGLGLNIETPPSGGASESGPTSEWLLATGFWNDSGVWQDTSSWVD